jgi:Tfp pilus assembly protein PilV
MQTMQDAGKNRGARTSDRHQTMRISQSGIGVIEVLVATLILMVCSLGIVGLISASIATNNRNKLDSTGTMLTQAVIERVKSTIIGSGTSSLADCNGVTWTIDTSPGGSAVSGTGIDFTETSPPTDYHMDYVVRSPCATTGTEITTYDVRWHVELVGAPATPTSTFLITVGARMKGHSEGNLFFSLPVSFRVMAGN